MPKIKKKMSQTAQKKLKKGHAFKVEFMGPKLPWLMISVSHHKKNNAFDSNKYFKIINVP